jgi:hypothetical protein
MRLLVLFIFTSNLALTQGPIDGFFKGEGNADFAIGLGVNRSNQYTGHPDSLYSLSYGAEQLGIFGQYGITDNFDAVLSVPFVFGQSENKFQDLGLHLKFRPLHEQWGNNEWSAILSGGISFPASDYQADVSGALGRREKKVPFRLINQIKFNSGVFLNLTAAYFIRFDQVDEIVLSNYQEVNPSFDTQQPSDHYSLLLRGGWASSHNFIELYAEYQNTLGGIDFITGINQPIQLYEVDFLKVGGTYYYGGEDNGVAVNVAYIPALRRNIGNIVYAGVSFIIKYRSE